MICNRDPIKYAFSVNRLDSRIDAILHKKITPPMARGTNESSKRYAYIFSAFGCYRLFLLVYTLGVVGLFYHHTYILLF